MRHIPFLRPLAVLLAICVHVPGPARADEAQALATALQAAAGKDWPAAQAVASGVGGTVVEWLRLRSGEGLLGDYEAFLARYPDWPGLPFLKAKGEIAVARSTDPARIIAYFGEDRPQTGLGALTLVRALAAQGRAADAEAEAFRAWTEVAFEAQQEADLLQLYGEALKVAHDVRLDRILWTGARHDEAQRMLPRVSEDWRALASARLALQTDRPGVQALVDAVPAALEGDPGLAYDRFIWRMKRDRYDDAAALILERSESAARLGNPAPWAERRALLARLFMRNGEAETAYRIAANNHLTSGADFVDLEFLAGFIALRKLGDPGTALGHFQRVKDAAKTPISLARGDYWIGRAQETAGNAAATDSYRAAARHQTAYYGLLAAERLGLTLDEALLGGGAERDWRQASFAGSSVLEAARLLVKADDRTLAKRFFVHLAEGRGEGDLGALADLALQIDEPHIALLVAKTAAERGVILPRAYYPVTDMVPEGLPVSRALALSISRRESEFDPAARSPVGARGLMQVMPATAEIVSRNLGLAYGVGKLTSDPAYNVTLGAQYLRDLVDRFGPSVALIASGYNAGPGRPAAWIESFGDPRKPDVDVVDWIETIPFAETRTYVMRVVEGVVIYRARLKGAVGPVRISAELKG
jgi:soluble lytic murein transglycosylase